jgi:hypothetical protein
MAAAAKSGDKAKSDVGFGRGEVLELHNVRRLRRKHANYGLQTPHLPEREPLQRNIAVFGMSVSDLRAIRRLVVVQRRDSALVEVHWWPQSTL